MHLILHIQSPHEWEHLLSFLQQQGIAFRLDKEQKSLKKTLSNKKKLNLDILSEQPIESTLQKKEKLAKNIVWEFSHYQFSNTNTASTFRREEIYEDAEWEKNLYRH